MPPAIHVGMITQAGGPHIGEYLRSLAETAEVATVSLADASGQSFPPAQKLLGKKLKATYASAAALFQAERPELALVTLEGAAAPAVISAALEANCHVLAEKPACVRPGDFEKLVHVADAKHRLLMLALANRISPLAQAARRLLQSGALGKLFGCEIHILADQTRLKRAEYQKSWFADPARAGGGHLLWLGIHWLDLAMYLTGSTIQEVSAFKTVVGGEPLRIEDCAVAALKFSNGSLGTIVSGYFLDQGYQIQLRLWGSLGWLLLDRMTDQLQWVSRLPPHKGQLQTQAAGQQPTGYPPFVRACVRAAAGLEAPPVTAGESLQALETVFACYRAAERGITESVPGSGASPAK